MRLASTSPTHIRSVPTWQLPRWDSRRNGKANHCRQRRSRQQHQHRRSTTCHPTVPEFARPSNQKIPCYMPIQPPYQRSYPTPTRRGATFPRERRHCDTGTAWLRIAGQNIRRRSHHSRSVIEWEFKTRQATTPTNGTALALLWRWNNITSTRSG